MCSYIDKMVEKDYVVRMINDMAKMIAKLIFNKDVVKYELPDEKDFTQTDYLYKKLLIMVDQGKINEAENQLYIELDTSDMKQLEMALAFYCYINDFDEKFLDQNDFSREEVRDGIKNIAAEFGVSYDTELFSI